jgi:hypothetical protein
MVAAFEKQAAEQKAALKSAKEGKLVAADGKVEALERSAATPCGCTVATSCGAAQGV